MYQRIILSIEIILLLLIPIAIVPAQTMTTGSIKGTVTDINNDPVPNMLITTMGVNSNVRQVRLTDAEGQFLIPNLPPGRYTITVEGKHGFRLFEKAEIEVHTARTTKINIVLQPAEIKGEVNIKGSLSGAVDITTATTGIILSADQFSNFPTQRTAQSLYTVALTVTRSGIRDSSGRDRDPAVAGSSGLENGYIIDGLQTSDPAIGGAGTDLPVEFIQEVEIKTGAFGAEYGGSTGGIFNVITKTGGDEFKGDIFAYFAPRNFVRRTKKKPSTNAASNGFSEIDFGVDVGGPIRRDRLWFYAALNPQFRVNSFLTQGLGRDVKNSVRSPFMMGKLTWAFNKKNFLNVSFLSDSTKEEGFMFGSSGFGSLSSFEAETFRGGRNFVAHLNSNITPTWIAEFAFGAHLQRYDIIPEAGIAQTERITDNFAIVRNGETLIPTNTSVNFGGGTGFLAFVDGRGGSLQRNYIRRGFAMNITDEDRDRYEVYARFQNFYRRHILKYGFDYGANRYRTDERPSGSFRQFGSIGFNNGFRVANNFGVCTVQSDTIICPAQPLTNRVNFLITAGQAPQGINRALTNTGLTASELRVNPFLILSTTSVVDSTRSTKGQFVRTNTESFYLQNEFKIQRNLQANISVRWDYQQIHTTNSIYLRLNSFKDNLQPRMGIVWDFMGKGKGKVFFNYAKFLEIPLPLKANVFGGGLFSSRVSQVNRLNAPAGSNVLADFGERGAPTPPDSDIKPQTVNEAIAGVEVEAAPGLIVGLRGVYRAQGSVIEDGSLDDGDNYFLFNPGESYTERIAREQLGSGFGRARRYYRALEISATKRFTDNYQFIASYVFSSLIGNYEGLFRNDPGQIIISPNLTSLFDLTSLLNNTYGRLPNDRPHQFKFNGSYRTPWKLLISGNLYVQSGSPFNALIPHPIYGDNNGFAVARGTAVNPLTGRNRTPTTSNLDLGIYLPIQVGEGRRLQFQLDWFNVINSQRALKEDETLSILSGIQGANSIQFSNPFYGEGLIYQFPSSVRLGVKFQF